MCETENPCLHEGTCELNEWDIPPTCNCTAGFTGVLCENVTPEGTTGENIPPETAAFGMSSATFDTANCGLIVGISLLLLRRRL